MPAPPSPTRTRRRLLLAVVSVLALTLVPWGAGPVAAEEHGAPGDFTGYAFDTCRAPSQRAMDRWWATSPYAAVGVYIGGANRACDRQRHLTRGWVRTQLRTGWRLLPLVVGRQASCAPRGYYRGKRISADPADGYAEAREQGRLEAADGVRAARRLGIGRGSVLWFDLEHFDTTATHCAASALAFLQGWTGALHRRQYLSGLYSSASSGIALVDAARRLRPAAGGYPDYVWYAEWNGRADLRSDHLAPARWWPNRRVHQYAGDRWERHGGVRLHVDANWMSTGRGTVGGPPPSPCKVPLGFRAYPALAEGDHGNEVRAAQCLLRTRGLFRGRLDGRYTPTTAEAVRGLQRRVGLRVTGRLDRREWTALLSAGPAPLLKVGSGGPAVHRLERTLNAAVDAGLRVDGVYGQAEERAVRRLQAALGLPRTGVATEAVWQPLQRGRVTGVSR